MTDVPRRQPIFGPETWAERAEQPWSWWDLWFCAVAVADSGGTLEADCRGYHLNYQADQALQQLAWMAVARRRFPRYTDIARRLGSNHWREIQALAESALRSNRHQLGIDVFRAADRPGWHQELLQDRCRALTGVDLSDHSN